jgi:hypothetical protein
MKLVAACLSPTRPLNESDMTECLSEGFSVLMAGDLNAKHTDWNSRLITARGSLLRDYTNRDSCLIHGPDSPTAHTECYPDVLHFVVVKDIVQPVNLSVCSALSSDNLPNLIDTTCRSSFQNLLHRPEITRNDWGAFQACLENRLPGTPVVSDRRQTTSASSS